MESELRALLSGVDDSVIGTLAKNDIRSLEDAKLLSVEDLKELGFSIGTRNRLLKLFSEAKSGYVRTAATNLASGIGASVKNLLLSGRGAGAASDLAKFKQVFNIGGQDATDKARRDRLYPCWDTNANGFLSLHEVDQGIKTTLIGELKNKPEAERIWRRFRRSYIRAFVDAADAAPQRSRAATTRTGAGGNRRAVSDDDYVTRREFRLLICYLSIYATMYELFAGIDGSSEGITVEDDNRISRDEWVAALPLIQSAAASWAPFVALQTACAESFDEIDTNQGGFILLIELCEWLEDGEKMANTPTGVLLGHGEE